VRVIIAYKVLKGSVGLAMALALIVLLLAHATAPLESIGARVHQHFTGAWSVELAKALLSAAEPRHLWLVALALALDGSFTLLEGWALYHAHWWGPWLVVLATSSLLPFEIAALLRKVHVGRVIVFAVNVAIVLYLARRALQAK
jgi:uncharacterized membrane protein (DUF2068 family)